jgi:Golgi nucleoside diphosphatase
MESFSLRIETVFVMISLVCFFISIYFVVFSLYVIVDELLKVQLLALASSFFVGGVVIAILSAVLRIAGMRALR